MDKPFKYHFVLVPIGPPYLGSHDMIVVHLKALREFNLREVECTQHAFLKQTTHVDSLPRFFFIFFFHTSSIDFSLNQKIALI